MPKKANPYLRVTSIGSFVNSEWKEYWYKSIEKGSKGEPGLLDSVANECITFSKTNPTAEQWKAFLAARTALKEAERIGKESTDFGTAVHSIAEAFLLGLEEPKTVAREDQWGNPYTRAITAREKFCGGLLVKWCKEAKVKPIVLGGKPAIETALQSETLGLTGHPDLVCTFGDDPTVFIIDWKTSRENRAEYGLQLAAYCLIIKEQFGVDVNDGAIVRVPSDPNSEPQFETHEYHNLLTKFAPAFISALETVQYFKKKGKWAKAA